MKSVWLVIVVSHTKSNKKVAYEQEISELA